MKRTNIEKYTFTVSNPRLEMTFGGRLLVRIIGAVSYALLIAALITLVFSDVEWLQWIGIFLGLFLLDRFFHMREADIPLSEFPASGAINPVRYTAPSAIRLLERAYERSIFKATDLCLEILRELIRNKVIRKGIIRLDVEPQEFEAKTNEILKEPGASEGEASLDEQKRERISSLLSLAIVHALKSGHDFVDETDIFTVLPHGCSEGTQRLLRAFGVDPDDLERALIFERVRSKQWIPFALPAVLGGFLFETEQKVRHRVMNRAWTARPTPVLDKYGTDFTDLARQRKVGFLIGHEMEYRRLVDTLARPISPNALLVGERGIGKETIIAHLAFNLTKDKVPYGLFDRRLVSLDLPRLVAGAEQEELHDRMRRIIEEVRTAGNVILLIPDIHNLVKTSGEAYLSAADALLPVIVDNAFPTIGTTYPREHKLYIEPRSDFSRVFETIQVEEITEEEAEEILVYESVILERRTRKIISFGAIKMAVRLAKKYFHGKHLPGSAEEILKGAVVIAERKGEKTIGPGLVIESAEEKTNVPIHEATGKEAERLLRLEDLVHERLVDQNEAVKAVSNALRSYRSGLTKKGGPIASFLFVGPTGVGKTELAKTLAKILFGSEEFMIRFDMTEYQERQSIYRFIGSPDGTIGGALTDAVLAKPYSLILLDEFEKANPDILNLFLQVLDDARLTDGTGRTVDFTNTLIIATSNAHANIINESLRRGQSMEEIGEYVKSRLVEVFKPELLNRFSRVVIFKDLGMDDVIKIASLQLGKVRGLVEERGISLVFAPDVIRYIAKIGYDPSFGARPLQRAIEAHIHAPLAEKILSKEIERGDEVQVEWNDNALSFVKKK